MFRKPTALNSEYFLSRFYRMFQNKRTSEYITDISVKAHFVGVNFFQDSPERPLQKSVISFLSGDFIHSLENEK